MAHRPPQKILKKFKKSLDKQFKVWYNVYVIKREFFISHLEKISKKIKKRA